MISNVEGAHKIAEPSGEPLHPTMAPTTTKASTTEAPTNMAGQAGSGMGATATINWYLSISCY
jgi:hypothetical protein